MDSHSGTVALLRRALSDEVAAAVNAGGFIRDGYNDEVDRLRAVSRDGKGWIAAFEKSERESTGISGLKVGYNRVFGYYLEVSRANQDRVPDNYERKQTLANAERYVTPELKEREAEVLGAEERAQRLEAHLFEELINELDDALAGLSACAHSVAVIDALAGFAEVAHRKSYCRPELHLGRELSIQEGRHPVVENSCATPFVANDCRLGDETALMVITGPNMAGKSTYLRQVALLTLMAHCGCYVPAASARVPLVDRIFTRIGASDDLGGGRSTFMVEMTETAAILDNMTDRSLVVLDEIGRGTSTFDGISIAWAVAEAMVRKGVKTLFATHYHELAALAGEHDAVANYSVAVRRHKGEVVFLYRIVAGAASGSYGIEVGRLAGLPVEVTDRAREILDGFETGEGPLAGLQHAQLGLFTQPPAAAVTGENDELLRELSDLDTDTISPLEALKILAGLVRGYRNRE
jgi:DNA mismatch repair protein MutS